MHRPGRRGRMGGREHRARRGDRGQRYAAGEEVATRAGHLVELGDRVRSWRAVSTGDGRRGLFLVRRGNERAVGRRSPRPPIDELSAPLL